MNIRKLAVAFLSLFLLTPTALLYAQDTPDDAAVWAVIELQWESTQRGDKDWMEELLSESFVGWANDSPAPQTKESITMWQRFQSKQFNGEMHELFPLSIVVQGDTAVAHYLYTNAGKDAEGKSVISSGRYTDVLVREEGAWKFIAWHGGGDDDD